MNIIKGIDRIALVLAVISTVLCFIAGWSNYSSIYKYENTIRKKLSVDEIINNVTPSPPSGY